MKECRVCGDVKPVTEYYKQARNRDGLFHECKECTNSARKQRYANNAEHYRAKERERYQKNKRYYIDKGMLYLKKRKGAMPKWLNEKHKFFLEEIYELRDLRTKATGIVHHVDHIIPLKGDGVCGLHVPWNLQILTAFENRAKGNRY
jgi:5-methylcytosine-specific restriction endonuclease McrA